MKKYKQKKISIEKYNRIMNKIIKMNLPVNEALVAMLEEASKYKLTEYKKK